MPTRRAIIVQLPAAAITGALITRAAMAADKSVTIGLTVPLTGSDAEAAALIRDGAMLAVDDANARGGVAGYKIDVIVLDNGTTTAGQYDPAQAATNARKLVADANVVANLGPEMSGSGKAMAPSTIGCPISCIAARKGDAYASAGASSMNGVISEQAAT